MTPHLAELPALAPKIDVARVRDLPALARALEYAAGLVRAKATSDGSIEAAIQQVAPLRMAALSYLDAARSVGSSMRRTCARSNGGRGRLDLAQDAVAIAGLFDARKGALAGKHPFVDAQLATLAERGAWLAGRLKPTGAVRDAAAREPAAQTKDRFAMLLEDDYAELLNAAAAVWGVEGMSAHVPALHAQTQARRGNGAAGAGAGVTPAVGAGK